SVLDPEAEAAEERVLVVPEPAVRRQLSEVGCVTAAEDDVLGQKCGGEVLDGLENRLLPVLVAMFLERVLADVVLERPLLVRKVAELHRRDDAVQDHRRAEAGAEPEEEHASAVVAPERLHRRVVDQLRRLAERLLEVESLPALAEIDRLAGNLAVDD